MYSNCLFEALKAKIRNPKKVQIYFLKGGVFGQHSHFMWKEGDVIKHAYKPGDIHWYNRWLFKPSFKTSSIETFYAYIMDALKKMPSKEVKVKYAKKLGLGNVLDIDGVLDWTTINPDTNSEFNLMPNRKDYELLCKLTRKDIPIKVYEENSIRTVSFDELLKLEEGTRYKYVTPFDEDYTALYGYLKSKKIMQELGT